MFKMSERFTPVKQNTQDNFQDFLFGPNGYYRTGQLPITDNQANLVQKGATMTGLTYVSGTSWFDPVYSAEVALSGLTRDTSIFKLLPKTTYQQSGDSYQVIATDSTANNLFTGESGVIFGTETDIPTITDVDSIIPAVFTAQWEDTEMSRALSQIQRSRSTMNPDQLKTYMTEKFLDGIDQCLAGTFVNASVHGVDTPATVGTLATIESIDRMLTTKSEGGTATYVSADTDGDIFWNNTGTAGTARYDRSGGTGWDCQIRLPTNGSAAAGESYNILDELDDLMAAAKVYAKAPYNYIGLCSPKAMNKIQNEIDPKQRFLEGQEDVTQTVNGVSTRPGVEGGKTSVSSLTICGVKVPMFESPYLMGTATTSWVWKNSKHTTGGPGNIYLINMDAIEYRTLIPITYKSWFNTSEADAPGIGNRHLLYTMGQLICKNWQSHAKLAYISS
jgi:hypothetical protein